MHICLPYQCSTGTFSFVDLAEASLNELSLLPMCAICWVHPRSLLKDTFSFGENQRCLYGACRSPYKCPYLARDISSSCTALERYPSPQADVTASLSKDQPYFGLCKHSSHPCVNYTHTFPQHLIPRSQQHESHQHTTRTSDAVCRGRGSTIDFGQHTGP